LREAKLINDINRDKNWVGLLFEIWYVGIVENEWKRVEILCENNEE
jgi:DNA mismatch repair protein MutH